MFKVSGGRAVLAATIAAVVAGGAGAAVAAIPGSGQIDGCYGKNGSLRVIDVAAGGKCSSKETPLAWSQTGPAGPAGLPGEKGETGPQGERGPQGEKGDSLTSFDSLNEMPCRRGGETGKIALSYGEDGTATLKCELPAPQCTDDYPDAPAGYELTPLRMNVPNLVTISGATCAGDEDWFVTQLTSSRTDVLPLQVRLVNLSGDADLCVTDPATGERPCSREGHVRTVTLPPAERLIRRPLDIQVAAKTPGSYRLEIEVMPLG